MRSRQPQKTVRAFTIVELLVAAAIISCLASILFPVASRALYASKNSNDFNLKKIALASIAYGDDYNERIPIVINGSYRNLRNTRDGVLTSYGEQRSDLWPLLVFPYLKDRSLYVDPERQDTHKIFSGPPLSSSDPGYDPYGATYRNQSRFPFFGVNYLFLSPFLIPASKMSDASPMNFMQGEVHRFFQADDPKNTVFYAPTMRGRVPTSADDHYGVITTDSGYFGVNAPGLYNVLSASTVPYVADWNGTACSADWCGQDIDLTANGLQRSQNFFYENPKRSGNNVAFLDGHVRFSKTVVLAAGTDYLTATPNGTGNGGGASIIDKTKYIWNLDDNYYGA